MHTPHNTRQSLRDLLLAALVVQAVVQVGLWIDEDASTSQSHQHQQHATTTTTTTPSSGTGQPPLGVKRVAEVSPVFTLPLQPDAHIATCHGNDGLGPALLASGTVVLGPESDLLVQADTGDDQRFPVASLRRWLSHQPLAWHTTETLAGDQTPCRDWPRHAVPWRTQRLANLPNSTFCSTDVVGTSCGWRSDWAVPACHPTEDICACPSIIVYQSTIETRYVEGVNGTSGKIAFFSTLAPILCTGLSGGVPEETEIALSAAGMVVQNRAAACTADLQSFCARATRRRVLQASLDQALAWPPVSYPTALRDAWSARADLRLRVWVPGTCDGNRAWVLTLSSDLRSLQLTCFWKLAATFTLLPAEHVLADPLLWYQHGVALTLVQDHAVPALALASWCLREGHLRSCSDPRHVFAWTTSSDALQVITLTDPDGMLDLQNRSLPDLTLLYDDLY